MSIKIDNAIQIAETAHAKQVRKWHTPPVPYIIHPKRVAERIKSTPLGYEQAMSENLYAAALLHDVVEDTDFPQENIYSGCGVEVYHIVLELTNPSGNVKRLPRAQRKALDRYHLSRCSREARMIKLADRIDNLLDMGNAEQDFKKLYYRESSELLEVLKGTHGVLESELKKIIDSFANG